jgi:hypothetical protein
MNLLFTIYNPITDTFNWTVLNQTYGIFDLASMDNYVDKLNTARIEAARQAMILATQSNNN